MNKVSEASVYTVKAMSEEQQSALGLRVLIMRRWPRGIPRTSVDVWLPDAGPSHELLDAYNQGLITWETFEERYLREQEQASSCRAVFYAGNKIITDVKDIPISPLEQLYNFTLRYETVTVMCKEKAGEHCHRHIVLELVK